MSHNEDLIKLVQLIEGKQQFAGELVGQRPGDQVRGTDKAVAKGSDHPFKGRLVGEETTLEDILAKKYQDFKEIQKKEKEQKQDEAANPAQQAAIAIAMKKAGKKPKSEGVSEGTSDLAGILAQHRDAVERFKQQGDLDYDLESDLWEYYFNRGDIKNYDADASGWIADQLADELGLNEQGVAEGKKSDRYHIVGKNGKPANLASYADRDSAIKDRNEKYPGAVVQQVGPRGKVKGVAEGSLEEIDRRGFLKGLGAAAVAGAAGGALAQSGIKKFYPESEIKMLDFETLNAVKNKLEKSGALPEVLMNHPRGVSWYPNGKGKYIYFQLNKEPTYAEIVPEKIIKVDIDKQERQVAPDRINDKVNKSGLLDSVNQGVAEGSFDNASPVASAIIRRILLQRTDLLSKYGPEQIGAAVDEVANFVGDVDEIGSSDVSGWVRHVERLLGNSVEEAIDEAVAPTPEGDQVWVGPNNKEFLLRKEAENKFKLYDKLGQMVKSWLAPSRYVPFYLEELGLRYSQLGTIALKDKNWSNIKEVARENPIDKITVDVPLMLRIMEYAREDANTDMDLHDVAERLIKLTSERGSLSMDDYDEIVSGSQVAEAIPPTTSTATTPPTGAKPAIGANAAPTSGSISPDEQTALNKIAQTPAMKQQFDKLLGQTQPAQANAPMKLSPDQENALDKLKTNAGLKSQYDRLIKQANPQAKI